MTGDFKDVAFLTRSVHRVEMIKRLRQSPQPPQALRKNISTSEITIRRNLEKFEKRGWVIPQGERYELTPLGEVVADEFTDMIKRMSSDMDSPVEAIAFVARSPHRLDLLDVLTECSRTRSELNELIDASSATLRRMLREYEARKWITRNSKSYDTTQRGELVAKEVQHLVNRFETKRKLAEISQWFPMEFDITNDMFDDAKLSPQNPNKPYEPNPRFAELIDTAETYRGIDIVSLKPDNVQRLFRNIAGGLNAEIIYPFPVLEDMLSNYPKLASKAIESGNFHMFAYQELPPDLSGGFALIDDRLVTCCRDYETGLPRTIIDTTASEAIDWARSKYDSFRREARLITDPASHFASIQVETKGSSKEEATPNVALPNREACYEQLRLVQDGEPTVCIYCDSENVIKKGKSSKGAQRYHCKDCEKFFNELTNTVFEYHKFPLEEMFYIIKNMRSRPAARIARDLGRDYQSVQNFVEEVRARDKKMLKQISGANHLTISAEDTPF